MRVFSLTLGALLAVVVAVNGLGAWTAARDEKRLQAPKISLSTTELDLGNFGSKKKLKGEILVTNTGKTVLDIRKMQVFTIGLQVSLKKSKIQPGETVKMKVTAVASDLRKARSKKPRILIITNDPDNAKVVVKILVK